MKKNVFAPGQYTPSRYIPLSLLIVGGGSDVTATTIKSTKASAMPKRRPDRPDRVRVVFQNHEHLPMKKQQEAEGAVASEPVLTVQNIFVQFCPTTSRKCGPVEYYHFNGTVADLIVRDKRSQGVGTNGTHNGERKPHVRRRFCV